MQSPRSEWSIITVLVVVEVISALEASMVIAATPTFMRIFDADTATVSWTYTAFLLVAAASAAICGRLGDMFGRERVLIVLLAVSVVGSLVSMLSSSLWGIVAGRAIQGVAGAILPLCIGLARQHVDRRRVPVAVALVSGAAVAAGAAALIVAGLFLDYLSWHAMFAFTAVYSVVAAVLVAFVVPRSTVDHPRTGLDWVGTCTFAPAIAATLLGLTLAKSLGWTDARIVALIVGGVVALAAWAGWELRHPDPIVNLRLLTDHKVALTMAATCALAIGPLGITSMVFAIVLQSPTTAPFGLGLTPTVAGFVVFVTSAGAYLCAPLSGRVAQSFGARRSLLIGTALFAVSAVLMVAMHDSVLGMLFVVASAAIGTAFAYTALPILLVEAVPEANTSEVVGTNAVVRTASMAIGVAIGMLVLSVSTVPETGAPTVVSLDLVAGYIVLACLATAAVALRIPKGAVHSPSVR
ncbi:MFS transporter [Nocardia sp. NPDC058480]|uniref:MFS transporter n=1 Tax=Nocardia sp. NPDC058480 TaxID=3346522 RepID=UPI003651D1D9